MFTNRELALALWSVLAITFALSRPDIRKSSKAVLKAFFQRKILVPAALMIVYTAGIVLALYKLHLWTVSLSKDTIVWFLFGAVPLAFSSFSSGSDERVVSRIVADSLRVLVIIEYLITEYTFSLPVEIVLVPLVTLVMIMGAVASSQEEYSRVASLLNVLQAVIGVLVFIFAISSALADYRNLVSIQSVRKMLLAPVMSLLLVPYVYCMLVYISYENLFIILILGSRVEEGLGRYAKRRVIGHLGFNLRRIRAFHRSHGVQLARIQSRSELDNLLEVLDS